MLIFYVILFFLIFGISFFLFIISGSSKIKAKNLSRIMVCLGINLLISPISFLIGGIADYAGVVANYGAYFAGESTIEPPLVSRTLYFLGGFFFIQVIPLVMLLVAFLRFIQKRKKG
ncbi:MULTISPECIES: hypothetical protein [Bacillus cereus group]|uniref:A0A023P740 (Uncharacterized protein) n=1 Tax=Bacillus cytotoxicus TaxID=580165 RepID=A0AAX2CI17_9BACI|nr:MULTISPECIES: hypothetical protein [Bacillus cereus group]AWC29134.1 hypothetical protein CG483_012875 [Bacillus cytotoxicus]AWC33122.1 hypothetical protein CG482_012485 [Bacillus cytotoxicus]AWC37149.1 hypothetical protein CG481_012500 [Bacillus cytotoxicus]AWC39480.1 hypothetical protein CG480_002375 [Bacillus cytotoxicus]AWC47411.1 hypothetical protein CG478_002375 [Bacillus cytotoxicus]